MSTIICGKCGMFISIYDRFNFNMKCERCLYLESHVDKTTDGQEKMLDECVKINQDAGLYDAYIDSCLNDNGIINIYRGGSSAIVMDVKDCPPAVTFSQPDEYEQQIIKWCDDLKCKLVDKYRKGKEEHGDLASGKPLDCAKEISAEVADILIYHCIDVVQKGKE